uniref:Reverse transcriptase domain-containing protein n=1 Tax=Macrostomum lignano TaxID=282301 RepID=A0A1I8JQ20_9PLAT
ALVVCGHHSRNTLGIPGKISVRNLHSAWANRLLDHLVNNVTGATWQSPLLMPLRLKSRTHTAAPLSMACDPAEAVSLSGSILFYDDCLLFGAIISATDPRPLRPRRLSIRSKKRSLSDAVAHSAGGNPLESTTACCRSSASASKGAPCASLQVLEGFLGVVAYGGRSLMSYSTFLAGRGAQSTRHRGRGCSARQSARRSYSLTTTPVARQTKRSTKNTSLRLLNLPGGEFHDSSRAVLAGGSMATPDLHWLRIQLFRERSRLCDADRVLLLKVPTVAADAPDVVENSRRIRQVASKPPPTPQTTLTPPKSAKNRRVSGSLCRRGAHHKYEGRLARLWHLLDIRPLLTHARPLLTETCLPVCLPLARLLTTDEQLTRPTLGLQRLGNTLSSRLLWLSPPAVPSSVSIDLYDGHIQRGAPMSGSDHIDPALVTPSRHCIYIRGLSPKSGPTICSIDFFTYTNNKAVCQRGSALRDPRGRQGDCWRSTTTTACLAANAVSIVWFRDMLKGAGMRQAVSAGQRSGAARRGCSADSWRRRQGRPTTAAGRRGAADRAGALQRHGPAAAAVF